MKHMSMTCEARSSKSRWSIHEASDYKIRFVVRGLRASNAACRFLVTAASALLSLLAIGLFESPPLYDRASYAARLFFATSGGKLSAHQETYCLG